MEKSLVISIIQNDAIRREHAESFAQYFGNWRRRRARLLCRVRMFQLRVSDGYFLHCAHDASH